jgi:guanine deaminase
MTLFRGTVLDTPEDPFAGGELRAEADAGVLVRDGEVVDRGAFLDVAARHPDQEVVDLSGGVLLPGFVDTHVHLPQVRVIGRLGMPLLDWLDRCALRRRPGWRTRPTRGPSPSSSSAVSPRQAPRRRWCSGPTSRRPSTPVRRGLRVGLRVTSGLVVSDRRLRADLLTTPERAYDEGLALARGGTGWDATGTR